MIERGQMEGKTNDELFLEYKETGDQRIKQELVLRYIYIVKNIAVQMKGVYASFAQMDDIINESVIGRLNSSESFAPNMSVYLETLARKQDWIPRNVRKNARMIDDATNELFNRLGRFPSDEEMAEYLGVSLEKYQSKLLSKTNLYNLISLDAVFDGQGGQAGVQNIADDGDTPEQLLENKEMEEILKQGIGTLRPNEQMVLSLHYRKELNMKEIASVMNLSESRISQIHTNALRKLRIYMQANLK